MRDYQDNEDDYPEEDMGELDRMFDMQDLFQNKESSADYNNFVNANRLILETTIRLLERSFWWRFRSIGSKMNILQKTYSQIQKLLTIGIQEELEEELEWPKEEEKL